MKTEKLSEKMRLIKLTEDHFHGSDLPEICSMLHMSWNGSGDPLRKKVEKIAIEILEGRLIIWDEPSSRYDNAIKGLILATLAERPNEPS